MRQEGGIYITLARAREIARARARTSERERARASEPVYAEGGAEHVAKLIAALLPSVLENATIEHEDRAEGAGLQHSDGLAPRLD